MLIDKTCETCGNTFSVKPYRLNSARFCSGSCRATWVCSLPHNRQPKPRMLGNTLAVGNKPNRTTFQRGNTPWNADRKGLHLSPATEFQAGRCSPTKAPIGTVSVRISKRAGYGRASHQDQLEPNVWKLRAVVVWEGPPNGPLPPGKLIHHKDRNALNDAIDNLECLTKAEHAIEHKRDLHEARWPVHAALSQSQTSLQFQRSRFLTREVFAT